MCNPGIALLAATGFQAFSQYQAGQSANEASKVNAGIMRQNAAISDKAALDATQRGSDAAARETVKAHQINAKIRARAGATGILADTGNYGDIQDQNTGMGEFEALTIRNNAERESYGYKLQSTDSLNKANQIRYEGKAAKTAGTLSALTTLVSGAATYGMGGFGGASDPFTGAKSFSMTAGQAAEYGPFSSATPWRNVPLKSASFWG